MPQDEFQAYYHDDFNKLDPAKKTKLEREFYKKFRKELKAMKPNERTKFKKNVLNKVAAKMGLKNLKAKALKKFGKAVGKKVVGFLTPTAAGTVVPGAGNAVGAFIGAAYAIARTVGDFWEICKCTYKCI